jgi:cathepsin X
VANYSKMYIDEFGGVEGEDDIKAEIFARGPVACGIDALPLESWDGKGIIDGDALYYFDAAGTKIKWVPSSTLTLPE